MAYWILKYYVMTLFVALGPGRVPAARIETCAASTALAAYTHGASPADALVLAEWRARESGCDDQAVNVEGGDCGAMQQRGVAMHGFSCAQLCADPMLAMSLWLEDLDTLRTRCKGSSAGSLSILSIGGACFPIAPIVVQRCQQAGLDPFTCEGLP